MIMKSPMLAKDADLDKISYPVYASPKLDGWRVHAPQGTDPKNKIMTRSAKPIKNLFIQNYFKDLDIDFFDGEIVVGAYNDPNVMQATTSGMKKEGEPDFTWWVFDHYKQPERTYSFRFGYLDEMVEQLKNPRIKLLPQVLVWSREELDAFNEKCLLEGFEGSMVRDPVAHYKFGRSTVKEGYLLKLKPWATDEAIILGFKEMMSNENELEENELGKAKRSTSKDGLVPTGRLGSYECMKYSDWAQGGSLDARVFSVSCGTMTMKEREMRWAGRHLDLHRIVRYKHLPHGVVDLPRHPLFDAFRDLDDLSPPSAD